MEKLELHTGRNIKRSDTGTVATSLKVKYNFTIQPSNYTLRYVPKRNKYMLIQKAVHGPRREERGPEKIFEKITAENVPNLGKETVT